MKHYYAFLFWLILIPISKICADSNLAISTEPNSHIAAQVGPEGCVSERAYVEVQVVNAIVQPNENKIVFVNQNVAGGDGTGSSWNNAHTSLADVLEYAKLNPNTVNEVWVAAGTYKTKYARVGNFYEAGRLNTFPIANLKLYGGFAGNEASLSLRNWNSNQTILRGNLVDLPYNVDKVVTSFDAISETILDGFIVEDAGGSIDANYPSGFSIEKANSRQIVNHCIFRNNRGKNGGAIDIFNTKTVLIANSLFQGNSAESGGAISIYDPQNSNSDPVVVINSVFSQNSAKYIGGAIFNALIIKVQNSIFWGNKLTNSLALSGFDIASSSSNNQNLFTEVSHSITQAFNGDGTNKVGVNPEFSNIPHFEFAPMAQSAAIEQGNSGYYDVSVFGDKDLYGKQRIQGQSIDIGVAEVSESCDAVIAAPTIADVTPDLCANTSPILATLNTAPTDPQKVSWYLTPTGGTPIASTTIVESNTAYYAAAIDNYCVSTARTEVRVNLISSPGKPVVTSPMTYVVDETAAPLAAQTSDANHTLVWYTTANSPTPIGTPTPDTSVPGSFKFYVSQVSPAGCESARAEIEVRVNSIILIPTSDGVIYVNKHVNGGNKSGNSWANAVPELAEVLEYANANSSIKEVWVAKGTYFPMYQGDGNYKKSGSDNTFAIANLSLYGGFNGTETQLTQRNWKTNPSILSGDIGTVDVVLDNIKVVVSSLVASKETVLDGFIIEKANGGGGLLFEQATSRHVVNHCIFRENKSDTGGGAIVSSGNFDSVVANTLFLSNTAMLGGAVASIQLDPIYTTTVVNCLFVNNEASAIGGATISFGNLKIQNSIAWGNKVNGVSNTVTADFTPGNENVGTTEPTVSNTITQVYTGSAQGARTVSGAIVADPLFTNPSAMDFSLQPGSPGINTGDNSFYDVALLGSKDLNGLERIRDNNMDMGAYEVQSGNNPLPLKLISFGGKQEMGFVTLTWKTAEEVNTSSFEIERSFDGKNFVIAGIVNAGFSGNHSYQFVDLNYKLSSKTYYRLKMIDMDGSFAYSNIVNINPDGTGPTDFLTVYPNPTVSEGKITIETAVATTGTLYDLTGRGLQKIELKKGVNNHTLPRLIPGVYLMSTATGQFVKLIVGK